MIYAKRHGPGYVYMLKSGALFKIGFSSRPAFRARKINGPNGSPILLHAVFTLDMDEAETFLHDKFRNENRRLPGIGWEWFELAETQVAWFCSLTELHVHGDGRPMGHAPTLAEDAENCRREADAAEEAAETAYHWFQPVFRKKAMRLRQRAELLDNFSRKTFYLVLTR